MNHKGTQMLETPRLILRKFTMDDCSAAYANWMSNPHVTAYLTWPPHSSLAVTEKIMKMWIDGYGQDNTYQWAIALRTTGAPIGSISVVGCNEPVNSMEIGYCIGEPWWGHGLTAEAFRAVIDFLFMQVGVNRIQAIHDICNPNSGIVMAKSGLVYEGTLRQYAKSNAGVGDMAIYGILARDYAGLDGR